jgi:hypothetical protein
LADFFFKLKPPSQAEGFGGGMEAKNTSSPPRTRDGMIDN